VARKLRVTELEQWANHELDGYYDSTVAIPADRRLVGELKALNPSVGWIPVLLPDALVQDITTHVVGRPLRELEFTLAASDATVIMRFESPQQRLLMELTREDFFMFALHFPRLSLSQIIDGLETLSSRGPDTRGAGYPR
jgi:hypothetical protein